MSFYKLSNKEKQIMVVLWNSPKALTASDICKRDETLNLNTVQAMLKKLLQHNFIGIEDIVYSGTVLAREYRAKITMDEYAGMQLQDYYNSCYNQGSISNVVNFFLDKDEHEEKVLDELQKMIDIRKKKLE